MRPPLLATALIAAVVPRVDYDSVAGDLYEEYAARRRSTSETAANRWYWSQTLRSLPALLSYSRQPFSLPRWAGTVLLALVVLVAMLLATIPINAAVYAIFRDHCPPIVSFTAYWLDAAIFGAVLNIIVRSGGVRTAFFAASFFALCFAVPALMGFPSSQAPATAWIILFGAIPAMCAGAGTAQALSTLRFFKR